MRACRPAWAPVNTSPREEPGHRGGRRSGPELLFELAEMIEHVLSTEDGLTHERARALAVRMVVALAVRHGARQLRIPRLRQTVHGLSWFSITARDRRIARAASFMHIETVASRFGIPVSVALMTMARVRIEERAMRLNTTNARTDAP